MLKQEEARQQAYDHFFEQETKVQQLDKEI